MLDLDRQDQCYRNITTYHELINRSDEWDMVTFDRRPYWDVWAFREASFAKYNVWDERRPLKEVRARRHEIERRLDEATNYLDVDR
eukprot:UN08287